METASDLLLSQRTKDWLEKELQDLEDAYAECLGDDVDEKTLANLWLRIKAIKRELALICNVE